MVSILRVALQDSAGTLASNKNRLWRSHGLRAGREIHRMSSGSVLDSPTFNNRVKLLKHTFSRVSYFPGDAAVVCSSNTGGRRN